MDHLPSEGSAEQHFLEVGSNSGQSVFGMSRSKEMSTMLLYVPYKMKNHEASPGPFVCINWEKVLRHAPLQAAKRHGDDTLVVFRVRDETHLAALLAGDYPMHADPTKPMDLMQAFPLELVEMKVVQTAEGKDPEDAYMVRNANWEWLEQLDADPDREFVISTNALRFCAESFNVNYRPSLSCFGLSGGRLNKLALGRALSSILATISAKTCFALSAMGSTSRGVFDAINRGIEEDAKSLRLMNMPLPRTDRIVENARERAQIDLPDNLASMFE